MSLPINLQEEGDLLQMLLDDYVATASPDDTYRLVGVDLARRIMWHMGHDIDHLPPQPTKEELDATIRTGKDRSYEERTGHVFKGAE